MSDLDKVRCTGGTRIRLSSGIFDRAAVAFLLLGELAGEPRTAEEMAEEMRGGIGSLDVDEQRVIFAKWDKQNCPGAIKFGGGTRYRKVYGADIRDMNEPLPIQ